ncbi:MAG: tRNA (adenosine(37)-N6)-threonylcarbamoyltransferase complex ATPase subunit type 1 TsaE [Firmicutes bacterium]|nr:tRNA (adenosine(37)-N6)-threonylcarbamoyltransferase complex ATPase subunit type 1 TsaE [Alicyclobacillaceae bacterium]MCL6497456.1 tRNA (adenosine(37)-N6)-threonylcarbamoyltransferase complex ATPase subunit type 1 TsaE [Bacillota bacterium]
MAGVDATERVGRELGRLFWPEAVVLLVGPLGSGKTTLVRAILAPWGLAQWVTSPTYDLVHETEVAGVRVYHADLFRLGDPDEVEGLDLPGPPLERAVVLAEWGTWLRAWYPERFEIQLAFDGPKARRLTVDAVGSEAATRLKAWASEVDGAGLGH